ncbi:MAG: YggS family pyridoxal phosphate-dependent enzyme [Niabella sp.]
MSVNQINYKNIIAELETSGTTLVAVSKTKPSSDIQALYDLGQRDFGENYVQELVEKSQILPADIRWHFIGHLQSNKVKYITPFVHLIHGVDSEKLLIEINKQAQKQNRVIDCLLQVHIATEETKFGFDERELNGLLDALASGSLALPHIRLRGLMGMASFTDNNAQVAAEFSQLAGLFRKVKGLLPFFDTLSMGMSGDYEQAIACGSNMVRIGSLLFGARN